MKRIFGKFLLAILPLGGSMFAQTLQYSAHLQEFGWKPEALKLTDRERSFNSTTHLAFDSSGRLYVGFAVQGEAKLARSGKANNIFRVMAFTPQTGAIERSDDYPTQSKERVGLDLTAEDQLLITANDKLQLIGKDESPRTIFDIPMPTKDNLVHEISVLPSASGKTLLLNIDWPTSYFFRTDSLSLIAHCEGNPDLHYRDVPGTFSDNMQMHFDSTTMGSNRLWAGPLCGPSTILWHYGMKVIEPVLLNDLTVLEISTTEENHDTSIFDVRKISGEILWSRELPKHFRKATLVRVRVARGGRCFAEEDFELHGGSRTLDISPKTKSMWVRVFDSQSGNQLGLVPIVKPGIREFALSPDGHRVATLSLDGGTLEVWRIGDAN